MGRWIKIRPRKCCCWKDKVSNSWKSTAVFLGKNKEILDAELWAIANGLDVARKITQETNTPITIFSDSQEALTEIQKVNPYTGSPYLKSLIHQKTIDLQQHGHPVTIRWIPSHVGLLGHEQADQKAKNRSGRGGKPEEQWSSLTYVKRKLIESQAQELTRWHETKRQERETSRRGFYIPRLEKGMSKVLESTSKKYASRYLQLKVGHGAVGVYLAKIGAIETPQCWWCGGTEQTVEHLYTKCRHWRKERRKLMRTLCKEGISCQGWTERKRLAELLANEKAMGPIFFSPMNALRRRQPNGVPNNHHTSSHKSSTGYVQSALPLRVAGPNRERIFPKWTCHIITAINPYIGLVTLSDQPRGLKVGLSICNP